MNIIPNECSGRADQKDYNFKILKRQGMVVLFEKEFKPHSTSKFYEVIILQPMPQKTFPSGKTYPAREAMPPPSKWGEAAWSPGTLEDAEKKFSEIALQEFTKEMSTD